MIPLSEKIETYRDDTEWYQKHADIFS